MLSPNRKISSFFFVLFAALIFLSGCEEKRGVKVGDTAPTISGNDIDGNYVSLAGMKGKTVVLYFWTDSCCGENLKQLEPFYGRNRDRGLEIIAVNEMDPDEKVRAYAARNALSFTMLTDEHSMLFRQYNVAGFPTIFILDRNGVIREKVLGDMPVPKLVKLIERHLDTR